MSVYLGIDTSNYTTSVALFDSVSRQAVQQKQLLPVRPGERGLRQSDVVFHHTVQLPALMEALFPEKTPDVDGIAVSDRPRDLSGSYMPCFLVGANTARCISAITGVSLSFFSHQAGHIVAALYSAQKLAWLSRPFLAFHVSGGTTEALLVRPDRTNILSAEIVAQSLDLKAGQAVDRVGIMLGLAFPCGSELEQLALRSTRTFTIRPFLKGEDCSLSGVENKCHAMMAAGDAPEDIALFCMESIGATLDEMTRRLLDKLGQYPLLYAGGVMSNSLLRARLTQKYGAAFAQPQFSSDNAAGLAVLASLQEMVTG